ncbi:PKD domain-containing protein [Nocardioides marmoribigeumensis]|uniref:M6 family metalloprotease-like protein n=1 Tax=Nocardioides marmoribigeumensis TaxID=433649 RepID=A0ABU2BWH1_9ACTN|nr:PKD domain-containing protein [Nocardioides marmoribigeumensis]MDR7362143.1 M6 family metalloprotease-like protein [Nocardioides marmoribigeumensis]
MNRTPHSALAALAALALALGLAAPSALAVTPSAAPSAAPASASDFLYYKDATAPACVGPVTLNVSDDPYFTRDDCGQASFTLSSDPAGAVTAKLFHGDATTAFATPDVTLSGTDGDVALDPDGTWPAGPVRVEVYDGATPAGSSTLLFNTLVAEIDPVAATKPGDAFTVTGTLSEVDIDSNLTGRTLTGVPGSFTLRVLTADGQTLKDLPVTAAGDGTFSAAVPGSATSGVAPGPADGFRTTLGLRAVDASYTDPSTGAWAADDAGAGSVDVAATPNGLVLENSFVSSVGWVKPGDGYPSRVIVRNYDPTPSGPVQVVVPAPDGTSLTGSSGPGTHPAAPSGVTWSLPSVPAASGGEPGVSTLVLSWKADTLTQDPTLVWKDLSSTASLSTGGQDTDATSHGPKVIPPDGAYDSARYGDRPFPIVPVDYLDRKHQADHSGEGLARKINSPAVPGSTYNLYQEMSLGQLYPDGDVPSSDIATKDFTYDKGFPFTSPAPAGTCRGATVGSDGAGTPLYPERIKDGFYQLPGTTDYYGDDKYGSAVVGSVSGVGALMDIDSACGPTAKLVWDAAAIADPEIDYSDFDTDKDGVVDFFMVVFAGCGGNGASQEGAAACPYSPESYDNVWPHSSSLEGTYTDPDTGLPGFTTDDQLKDLRGRPLWYTDSGRTTMTTTDKGDALKVFVRVGPYNVNPETAIDKASVISHEYGHSLGLPDFYSLGSRETYGDWTLMAEDKSQDIDAFGRQELGWVVPQVLDSDLTVTGWKDSKEDTDTIRWRKPDGTPYTLTETAGGARVQNSQMYVAKLPGRRLITESDFDTGDKASKTHAWWSGAGNDFGCTPSGGHNLDLAVPGLADLPQGTTLQLSMKSRFDIEWDFDYGFVLTTKDGGSTYTSHPSTRAGNATTTPAATNPNQNACQAKYGNGITGDSASYRKSALELQADRATGATPPAEFLADSFDVSDLVGAEDGAGALRLSYSTDPGLARPGWFIDDLKVTATLPDNSSRVLLDTDFEGEGGPEDYRVFNGGCKDATAVAKQCTQGWNYVDASSESPADHAYYLELRDRSGFDEDSKGENDRSPLGFQPGLYVSYTDESHGYGNVGTDDPPAQSPLDSQPEPGSETPDLDDAAWTAASGDSRFTDSGAGHTDNYTDPSNSEVDSRYSSVANPWRFRFGCLTFDVTRMSGTGVGPSTSDGDLTGDVTFDMGAGCGTFDYGYGDLPPAPENTAPTADAKATPTTARTGQQVAFDATGSTDAEDPSGLDYSWDFDGNGTKDSALARPKHAYGKAGTYRARLTVTDPQGLTDTDTVTITVTTTASDTAPTANATATPTRTRTGRTVTFSGQGSSDKETAASNLRYSWSFGDGGTTKDATGRTVRHSFGRPGTYTARLTVTDAKGAQDTDTVRVAVGVVDRCETASVKKSGDWRVRKTSGGNRYCTGARRTSTLVMPIAGGRLELWFGRAKGGGRSRVYVDGRLVGRLDHSRSGGLRLGYHRVFTGLGGGNHRVVVKPTGGRAWVDYDVFYARRTR